MGLDNSGHKKLKVNLLIAVLIQQGNFCLPTPVDNLLNNIFKEANVSNSPKEILHCQVLVKAGSEIGKSLLIKPLKLFCFVILSTTFGLHPHGKYNRSIQHLLIYKIFSYILFFKTLCISYFLDFVYAFKTVNYISISKNWVISAKNDKYMHLFFKELGIYMQ